MTNKCTIGLNKTQYISSSYFKNYDKPRLNAQFTINSQVSEINNSCQQSKCSFDLCVPHVIFPTILEMILKNFN